jgi:hypothetical protein
VPRIDVVMISQIRYIWVQSCCVNPTWAAPRGNATYGNFGGAHVFRSIDNGETWHNLDGSGSNGLPDVALADSHAGWTETVTRVYAWPRRVARHSSVKFANGVNPTRSCQRARVSSHARGGRGHRLWTSGDADRAERREPSDGW